MRLRSAEVADAAAIAALYAPHVLHGTATFEEEAPGAGEMALRIERVRLLGWPWLVLADGSDILGYAYAAQFRDRHAYRFAAEDSVYIRDDCLGRGHGRRLLTALLDQAVAADFRRMFAVIGDSANHGSIRLHEALGFSHAGCLRNAGFKFGRWLDVVLMERDLP